MHLLLFMTRGMSLAAWEKNGSLPRELALYEKLAGRGVKTGIISWGGREERAIARRYPWLRVYGNFFNLPVSRYERLIPLLHTLPLINADLIKSNQTNGADLALRCALFWRKPFVARCGYVWSEFVGKVRLGLLEQVLNLEKEVFSRCHKAIVTSEEAVSYLSQVHGVDPGTFTCIPNYVPDSFYAAPVPDYHPRSPAIITQVGRLGPQKNLFALLEACAGLDVTVRLIGDGEEKEALEAYAREHGVTVEFKGNVAHEKLPELLTESTLCVLVSLYEGHPKALIEYMACGCPVLATNVSGIRTIIQNDVSGVLCETSAASIRAGVEKLLENPALRERLGRRAREEAKRYALEVVLKKEWKIYTSFPRIATPQKWMMALRAMAGYAKHKCRSLLRNSLVKLLKTYADKKRFLLNAIDDAVFLSLPDDRALAAIQERISKQIAAKHPADSLRILFTLDANIYQKQGKLAVAYGNGIHTKHRHIGYHDFFINRLRKNEKVLDVGCGIGFLSFDMADKAQAIVTGIELDEENIRFARSKFSHPSVEYIHGNALTDLPDARYDTVVLSNVLEHLPARSAFLGMLQKKLHPKRFLLRVPLFERDWRVPLRQELGVEWRLDPTHETEYTYESFVYELGRGGLFISYHETRWGEIWCEASNSVDYAVVADEDSPITVLMVTHNDEDYIAEAIDSILRQAMRRFLLLIIDDASTDGTPAILQELAQKDARIRVVTNPKNIGLTASLNMGLENITTPYIARMDADDIALPERLELQLAYMEGHPEAAAAGCYVMRFIEESPDAPPVPWFPPVSFDAVRRETYRIAPQLSHPGSILRTDAVKAVAGYREQFATTQDYDLWFRLLEKYELGNIPNLLLLYRYHQKTASCAKVTEQSVNHILAMQSSEYRRQGKADPIAGKELTLALLESLLDPSQCSCYVWIRLLVTKEIENRALLLFQALSLVIRHETSTSPEDNELSLQLMLNNYERDELYKIFSTAHELKNKTHYPELLQYVKIHHALVEESESCA
jgi:glycosyltransferase involved in cell wall biosynthesis